MRGVRAPRQAGFGVAPEGRPLRSRRIPDGVSDLAHPRREIRRVQAQSKRDTGTSSPAATPVPSSGSHASTRAPASEVIA